MRIAVFSDIHANRPALEAVLADSQKWGVEHFWCLGDMVGYGPHPTSAMMFLKRYVEPDGWVIGNHDAMLADLMLPEDSQHSNQPSNLQIITAQGKGAQVAVRGQILTTDAWAQINSAPIQAIELNRAALITHPEADAFWRNAFTRERVEPRLVHLDGIDHVLVHGSQDDPFRYIYDWHTEILLPKEFAILQRQSTERGFPRVQWFGHTHVPTLVQTPLNVNGDGFDIRFEHIWPQQTCPLDSALALINPGSVGQPRDLDPRAAYAILDTVKRTVTFRRVAYDWRETAHDMLVESYPESLIDRLRYASAAEKETPNDRLAHYREAKKR